MLPASVFQGASFLCWSKRLLGVPSWKKTPAAEVKPWLCKKKNDFWVATIGKKKPAAEVKPWLCKKNDFWVSIIRKKSACGGSETLAL